MPTTSSQPEASRAPTSHSGRRPPTSDATSATIPTDRHEDDDRQGCVGRERDRARRDPAVDRALGSRGAAQDVLGPVVEPCGGSTDAADHLLGEPRGLPGDRVPELGARGDVAQNALRLVAGEHSVGELERLRGGERGGHEALQFAARGELGGDAFEDAVADERARDLFRQRTGERPVEDAGDLGRRENLVHRLLERSAPDTRGSPCREEGGAPGRVGQPGAGFVVVVGHQPAAASEPP